MALITLVVSIIVVILPVVLVALIIGNKEAGWDGTAWQNGAHNAEA
jgi:hypothetical protein